jgi:hypothetical protein
MSRVIKFRAWDGKQMIESPGMVAGHFDDHEVRVNEQFARSSEDGGYVWMQFTGLLDSGKREIYEGDVVYVAGYGDMLIEWPFDMIYEASFEGDVERIKGNVHENPELLKA